jgi:hypothetical protein
MNKQIMFKYESRDYTLEFTRKTVMEMEKKGFVPADITSKPMTLFPILFAGAFLANHRYVKADKIEEIFSNLTNRDILIGQLVEMYNSPILDIIDGSDNATIEYTANW